MGCFGVGGWGGGVGGVRRVVGWDVGVGGGGVLGWVEGVEGLEPIRSAYPEIISVLASIQRSRVKGKSQVHGYWRTWLNQGWEERLSSASEAQGSAPLDQPQCPQYVCSARLRCTPALHIACHC